MDISSYSPALWLSLIVMLTLIPGRAEALFRPWGTHEQGERVPGVQAEWFLADRAHVMQTSGTTVIKNKELKDAVWNLADELDAGVVTRHVKTLKGKDPSWPSALPLNEAGTTQLNDQPDDVAGMVQEAAKRDVSLMTYYFISIDARIEALHPEWVCKDPRGRPIRYKPNKGYEEHWLDITGPYREVVLQRLLELGERGVKGLMFDEIHMPFEGAWGTATQEAWEQAGNQTPKKEDLSDPNYRAYVRFMYDRVWETFAYWRREVHKKHPNLVFTVSVTSLPKLLSDRMPSKVGTKVDAFKNEFTLPLRARRFDYQQEQTLLNRIPVPDDIRMGFGWALLRDSSVHLPPRIWAQLTHFTQAGPLGPNAVMLYGCVANLGTNSTRLKGKNAITQEQLVPYREAIAFGKEIGRRYEGRNLGLAGILFSERLRDRDQGDWDRMISRSIRPALGWYWAGTREGMPLRMVTDWQLPDLDPARTPILCVPAKEDWDKEVEEALNTYRMKGGKVLSMDSSWDWSPDTEKDPRFDLIEGESDPLPDAVTQARHLLRNTVTEGELPWSMRNRKTQTDDSLMGGHVVVHPRASGSWVVAVTRLPTVHKEDQDPKFHLRGQLEFKRKGYRVREIVVGGEPETVPDGMSTLGYKDWGHTLFEVVWEKVEQP